jgi:hypothetical protein
MGELSASKPLACGLLEMLWHFTGRFAPRGDVGRWSDIEIEKGVGWEGEPGSLIPALVKTRWIDSEKSYRLLIHDWPDHCDQTVKKYLKRNGLRFATKSGRRPDKVRPVSVPPLPLPVPVPVPTERKGEGPPIEPPAPRVVPETRWPEYLALFGEAWRSKWGINSLPPWGEMSQWIGPLIQVHELTETLERWKRFLDGKPESQFCRPRRFAEGFDEWSGERALAVTGAPPRAPTGRRQTAADVSADTMRRAMERARKGE